MEDNLKTKYKDLGEMFHESKTNTKILGKVQTITPTRLRMRVNSIIFHLTSPFFGEDFSSQSTKTPKKKPLENPSVELAIGDGGARYKRHSYVPGGSRKVSLHHDIPNDNVTLTFHKKNRVHL